MIQAPLSKSPGASEENLTPPKEMFGSSPTNGPNPWTKPSPKSNTATPFCKICFEPISDNRWCRFGAASSVCSRCQKEMKPKWHTGKIAGCRLYWLYFYNDTIRSLLYQFKGCGDYELKDVFFAYQRAFLRAKFHSYVLVPAPSYHERDEARGFNHVAALFSCLGLPMMDCLIKTENIKQADLHLEERKQIGRYIQLTDDHHLCGKKLLLVDDLVTSGSTIKACIKLLRKCRPKKIVVLTMGRTPRD